jgi:hypothetical protein
MRPTHSSVMPLRVRQLAAEHLRTVFDWKPYGRSVTVDHLLSMLLLMATHATSLFDIVRRHFAFSPQTVYKALKANALTSAKLTEGLNRALHDVLTLSRLDRRRAWNLAIDTHYVPYYGQKTAAILGGPRKQGTKCFHGYATAVLIHRRRRYTVALCALTPDLKPHEIVQLLLAKIDAFGLNLCGVTLDSAFDSGDTILLLQERGLAYAIPLRRKGRGSNARNRYFERPHDSVSEATWVTEKTRKPVTTAIYIWHTADRVMVFAYARWSGPTARTQAARLIEGREARAKYRDRFSIETSYRQKNQAQAKTTSRDAVYRLLLEGIGYLLRQLWVLLTEEIAFALRRSDEAWIGELTLKALCALLADALRDAGSANDPNQSPECG